MSSLAARQGLIQRPEGPPRPTEIPALRDGLIFAWHPTPGGGVDFAGVRNKPFAASVDNSSNDLTYALGEHGRAWSFSGDATNDRVDLGSIPSSDPLSLAGKTEYTILALVRKDDAGTFGQFRRIIDKSSGGSAANGWELSGASGANQLQFIVNGSGNSITSNNLDIDDGKAHLVGVKVWGTGASSNDFYVDGIPIGRSATDVLPAPPTTTTNAAIGNWNHSTNRMWQGPIFNVFAWEKSLDDGVMAMLWPYPSIMYWSPKPLVPGWVAPAPSGDIAPLHYHHRHHNLAG